MGMYRIYVDSIKSMDGVKKHEAWALNRKPNVEPGDIFLIVETGKGVKKDKGCVKWTMEVVDDKKDKNLVHSIWPDYDGSYYIQCNKLKEVKQSFNLADMNLTRKYTSTNSMVVVLPEDVPYVEKLI